MMKNCAKIFVVVFSALFHFVSPETFVTVYEHANYKGGAVVLEDLDLYSYIYFTVFDDHTSSFKINRGSCVEMHMNTPPGYDDSNDWFWTSQLDYADVGPQYNDRISSVKACGSHQESIHCPDGTFVKKIQWDDQTMMTNGIELYCFAPNSVQSDISVRTHGSGDINGKSECTGIRGIRYNRDDRRLADVGMEPLCKQEESGENLIACGPSTALAGMWVEIENRCKNYISTGFIKSSTLECRDVGDIESICAAHDKTSLLFTCDASEALYPLKCTHTKTVGFGRKTSLSQEERNEQMFYEEFNFDIGAAGYGLSANFKYNLSYSEVTGYSWETTQESTFQEEISMQVEAEAPAGCVTQVVEVIGECSFIQVRPYYFKRIDNCDGRVFETDESIPENLGRDDVYLSKIPQNVLNHLNAKK